MATGVDGSRDWALSVLATHSSYGRAEEILGADLAALTSVRPQWRESSQALLAVSERVTGVLPEASAAWAMRAEACMGIGMGSSIAAEFYEKAVDETGV